MKRLFSRREWMKGSMAAAAVMAMPRGGITAMQDAIDKRRLTLRCEYATNPIGLGEASPRFSWTLRDDRVGARQSRYRIRVASSPDHLSSPDLWDSGEVASDASLFIPYRGKPLVSRQRACWDVQLWDERGEPVGLTPRQLAHFEIGLLDPARDLSAHWIESDLVGNEHHVPPVPYLRRTIELGEIASARLYISALGLYDAYINGQRVGDARFRPGWTDYQKRIQLDTYNVTALLRPGANVVAALLGDGWYCGYLGFRNRRQFYGDRPKLLAQLEVTDRNGKVSTFVTDESWRWSPSHVIASDMLDGESVDRQREIDGWNSDVHPRGEWKPARVVSAPAARLVCAKGPPCRVVKHLPPVADPTPDPTDPQRTRWIFDLGQNMVGVARLKVSGPAGTTVRLRFAEMLDRDGSMYLANLREAKCTDHYTLRGDQGGETFEPVFTFHGFRYVEVTGLPTPPTRDTITGVVIHSDMDQTGRFECSDPLINQLQRCIEWGQRGNFLEVPTDCPQRNERLGWTGDAQVFAPTACFNFDSAGFYAKWQDDLDDAQGDDGHIPPVVPTLKLGHDGGPAWADAVVIVPWSSYRAYDDRRLLESHFDAMRRYLDFLENRNSIGLIRCHPDQPGWRGYGDWLSPEAGDPGRAPTPRDLIGTAYFARCAFLCAEIAQRLDKTQDEVRFRQLHARVKEAFAREFISPAGRVVGDTQTGVLLALAFDLVPTVHRARVEKQLVHLVHERGDHLATGFVGTPLLLPTLNAIGQTDLAYKVLKQESYPGWLFTIKQGATTMWERWNSYTTDKGFGDAGMNSFNHYAYGAVGEWLYATIGGIQLIENAYKRSHIAPMPGGGITWARCALETPYGTLSTDWKDSAHSFDLNLIIPANTAARVTLPVTGQASITVNGKPATSANGVSAVEANSFDVVAGRFSISARKG